MEHRALGSSGLSVSALSLGSWRTFERIPREQGVVVMTAAREAGIDFLDDARYDDETGSAPLPTGYSEVVFGELFRASGWKRDEVVLANKLWWEFWPEQSAAEELEASLGRMGLDHIDLIYAEQLPEGLEIEEAVDAVGGLIRSGKARAWGILNWRPQDLADASRAAAGLGVAAPCAAQLAYSLAFREMVEDTAMEEALAVAGTSVVASAVLAGGALSGKYGDPHADGRLAAVREDPRRVAAFETGERLSRLASELSTTPCAARDRLRAGSSPGRERSLRRHPSRAGRGRRRRRRVARAARRGRPRRTSGRRRVTRAVLAMGLLVALVALPAASAAETRTPVVVIDPGHDLHANPATEPIGPGSSVLKIKDGGGTHGVVSGLTEAELNLRVALRLRPLLEKAGVRIVMTRTRTAGTSIGNIARATIANRAHAALFLRIHADGSADPNVRGTHTLYPALQRGWTDDVYASSKRAARIVQADLRAALGFPDRGLQERSDYTGFNWANVPVILVEMGFMTNPTEDRLLATAAYQQRAAVGFCRGTLRFLGRSTAACG